MPQDRWLAKTLPSQRFSQVQGRRVDDETMTVLPAVSGDTGAFGGRPRFVAAMPFTFEDRGLSRISVLSRRPALRGRP
jgi:hypothetical protein